MARYVLGSLATLAIAAATLGATVALAREQGWALPRLPFFDRPVGPVTVVLHRHGGEVWAAENDAPGSSRSGTLLRQGVPSVEIPPFQGSDQEWDALVRCVQERFDGLAVDVVDEPPASGPYTLAYVGGTPGLLGYADTVGGIAPHAGRVLEGAVLFVFQPEGASARSLCETAAHEVGHTLGLDHSRDCTDVMSYEACGPKEFRPAAAACGEWEDRACDDGHERQSSWQRLVAGVGERPRRVRSAPPATPPAWSGTPTLEVHRSAQAIAGAPFSVTVDVGQAAIEEVELHWYARRGHRLRCSEAGAGPIPFTCTREGSTYVFTLTPDAAGPRKFVARVRDASGRLTRTPTYRVEVERAP